LTKYLCEKQTSSSLWPKWYICRYLHTYVCIYHHRQLQAEIPFLVHSGNLTEQSTKMTNSVYTWYVSCPYHTGTVCLT
jgi:hypothetical protein